MVWVMFSTEKGFFGCLFAYLLWRWLRQNEFFMQKNFSSVLLLEKLGPESMRARVHIGKRSGALQLSPLLYLLDGLCRCV